MVSVVAACYLSWFGQVVYAFTTPPLRTFSNRIRLSSPKFTEPLEPHDVVTYQLESPIDGKTNAIGVILADGRIQPLCVWELPAREFLWDDEQEHVNSERVVARVDGVFCEQRKVGGGLGPTNPHGEESEDVYLIYKPLDPTVFVPVRPEREVFW